MTFDEVMRSLLESVHDKQVQGRRSGGIMPWWLTSVVIPLLPAIIAFLLMMAYVPLKAAVLAAIGHGQLFFITVALAARSLGVLMSAGDKRVSESAPTIVVLFLILIFSVVLYASATIWKLQPPPQARWANVLTIGGSVGLLLWATSISSELLSVQSAR